jgi:hypothetical protein
MAKIVIKRVPRRPLGGNAPEERPKKWHSLYDSRLLTDEQIEPSESTGLRQHLRAHWRGADIDASYSLSGLGYAYTYDAGGMTLESLFQNRTSPDYIALMFEILEGIAVRTIIDWARKNKQGDADWYGGLGEPGRSARRCLRRLRNTLATDLWYLDPAPARGFTEPAFVSILDQRHIDRMYSIDESERKYYRERNIKRQRTTIHRAIRKYVRLFHCDDYLLKPYRPHMEKVLNQRDSIVENSCNLWIQRMDASNSKFEEVTGQKLAAAYRESFGASSCMTGAGRQSFLQLYTTNPKKVALLKGTCGKQKSRCIIWTFENGQRYMDRVYSNAHGMREACHKYARKNGWWYYDEGRGGYYDEHGKKLINNDKKINMYSILKNSYEIGNRGTPYMDTMKRAIALRKWRLLFVHGLAPAAQVRRKVKEPTGGTNTCTSTSGGGNPYTLCELCDKDTATLRPNILRPPKKQEPEVCSQCFKMLPAIKAKYVVRARKRPLNEDAIRQSLGI